MPQYSLKLCTYDPNIIDAFARLRKNRKQAAFTHEALKQFLSSEKGCQVLQLMEGRSPEPSATNVPSTTNSSNPMTERAEAKILSGPALQGDSSSVLDSILN